MNTIYVKKLKTINLDIIFEFMKKNNFNKVVIFDTETTGLDHKFDEIIDYGSLSFEIDLFNNIYTFVDNFLIKPEKIRVLPEEIIELTGLTNEIVFNTGIQENKFIDYLTRIFDSSNVLIIGYNLNFDLSFISNYINLNKNNFIYLDLYTVFRDIKSYPNKLFNALEYYNITDVENSHRAIDDAFATLKVFIEMLKTKDDLNKYFNIFGYNPKYYDSLVKLPGINYKPQSYDRFKLYNNFKYIYED